jgi:hypothetical protein
MASWIGNLLTEFKGEKPVDRLLVPDLVIPNADYLGANIVPDECYLEIYVESLRVDKIRKWATTFNGVVYTAVGMSRLGQKDLALTAVSKPDSLKNLDSNTARVVTVSRKVIGPVAWRGGSLHLELALLSVKTGNILTPVIDLITQISAAAGISFVGRAAPFIPLMTKGLDLIAGQAADTAIEVGLDTDLSPTHALAFAIIDAPKQALDTHKITVDETDHKLLINGKPLEVGYCVFSIRCTTKKVDFGEIEDLRTKWDAFQSAKCSNKRDDAAEALTALRLALLSSPDLIRSDALWIVNRAQQDFDDAFPTGMIIKHAVPPQPISFSDIGLYDEQR